MSLASKLPWNHRFAGGYPGLSSQPLPTDADAIDYLTRMATADGAGVEVGVATAVDAFFRDAKAAGVFPALKACCILAGARTLAGALVPVVGDAPTNVAEAFVGDDYSRTAGLTGDGATTYLDSGRASNADLQNDRHISVYITSATTKDRAFMGSIDRTASPSSANQFFWASGTETVFCAASSSVSVQTGSYTGSQSLLGVTRSSDSTQTARLGGNEYTGSNPSVTPSSLNTYVFARNDTDATLEISDATIAFYSIGESLSLEDLDTAVTNLITAIGNAL